jgi:Na+-transporting NADH:ubiquinone oxidoreductase subunit B
LSIEDRTEKYSQGSKKSILFGTVAIMKFIQKIFDSKRNHFVEGGRFEKFHPIFEAFETFFFIPANVTKNDAHVRDNLDLKRLMSLVTFAAVFIKGLQIVLPIIIVSYGVGFAWEVLFASIRRHNISEGFLVTGLLFPLTLPPTIPLWQVALGISFGVIFGKEIFGGTGRNFLNPALTGRAFLFFAYPIKMTGDTVWTVVSNVNSSGVDTFSGATPLAVSAVQGTSAFIESLLSKAGFTLPKLFYGLYPGSIGGTSALMCLMGACFLIFTGIASYRIIIGGVVGILVAAIPGYIVSLVFQNSTVAMLALPPLNHLVMGGFAFGITYMATDPVSAPGMKVSKWIYGFAIGALTVMIRVFNPAFPEGIMLAILFMNLFSPLLDHFEIHLRLKKRLPNV